MSSVIEAIIQPRSGTAAEWTSANPVLFEGEQGNETDTDSYKIGDGVTAWNDLDYFYAGRAGGTTAQRPVSPRLYEMYADSTLQKPIWWWGAAWKDAAGTTV